MAALKVDDKRLVQSHQEGDPAAFDAIVELYRSQLLGHAIRRLNDQRAAEDAVQETLLRAYRALPRFNGQYHLGPWLHRILANVCADEGNRRRREFETNQRLAGMAPDAEPEPHERVVADLDLRSVARALSDLPPTYRQAMVLREVEGLQYSEVAEAAGITEENARARVHRAREQLRKMVERTAAFALAPFALFRRGARAAIDASGTAVVQVSPAATEQVVVASNMVQAKSNMVVAAVGTMMAATMALAPSAEPAKPKSDPAAANVRAAGPAEGRPEVVVATLDLPTVTSPVEPVVVAGALAPVAAPVQPDAAPVEPEAAPPAAEEARPPTPSAPYEAPPPPPGPSGRMENDELTLAFDGPRGSLSGSLVMVLQGTGEDGEPVEERRAARLDAEVTRCSAGDDDCVPSFTGVVTVFADDGSTESFSLSGTVVGESAAAGTWTARIEGRLRTSDDPSVPSSALGLELSAPETGGDVSEFAATFADESGDGGGDPGAEEAPPGGEQAPPDEPE